ncbi:MAG: hypothetical protein OXN84_12610 [Albidovulum sp.]|nr:hypothetical protein [Albidovulum sp.]
MKIFEAAGYLPTGSFPTANTCAEIVVAGSGLLMIDGKRASRLQFN